MGRPIPREQRPGFRRSRPMPAKPVAFTLDDHAFETDGTYLWVTPPGSSRVDRMKITRFLGDISTRNGYPRELVRPETLTEDWARTAAAFWLDWSSTPEAAAFPPVYANHWVRQQERLQLAG